LIDYTYATAIRSSRAETAIEEGMSKRETIEQDKKEHKLAKRRRRCIKA
jgi:hypothetical protein